jgi:hypothetical protein
MKTRKLRVKRRKTYRKGGVQVKRTSKSQERLDSIAPIGIKPNPVSRSKPKIDRSADFQNLIDGVGVEQILKEFAEFIGRSGMETIAPDGNPDRRRTRRVVVGPTFTGIAFDGAHWKGYENGQLRYDSYVTEIQRPGTNNYCQSYAAYLWAKQGDIKPFVQGEYSNNVMRMSNLWYNFLTRAKSGVYGEEYWEDIKNLFELEGEVRKYDIEKAIKTLDILRTNIDIATDFANSKEDSVS